MAIKIKRDSSTIEEIEVKAENSKINIDGIESTDVQNGLLEIKTKIDENTSKSHTHSNKSVIDTITSTLISHWNSAYSHITDTVKHITSAERTLWNTVSDKLDASANAVSATKLKESKTISLNGDVTGSIEFDGSKDVSITTTVTDNSHNHTIDNIDGLQDELNNKLDISDVPASLPANGGNADTANKLSTARTISLSGDVTGSTSFDGSKNVSISATVTDNSHKHIIANVTGLQDELDSKVDNSRVLTDVPENAKFTDTVYVHPETHPASMITGLATVATSGSYDDLSDTPTIPTSLPANGGNADTVDGKHASDFATAEQGEKADNALPKTGGIVDGYFKIRGVALDRHFVTRGIGGCTDDGENADNLYINYGTDYGVRVGKTGQFYVNGNGEVVSPKLTGSPTAPTPSANDNSTRIATTAYVQNALSDVGAGDMLKSTYDADGDGVVDNAEKLNNKDASYYINIQVTSSQPTDQRTNDLWLEIL